jgi:phosphate transport system permease protein
MISNARVAELLSYLKKRKRENLLDGTLLLIAACISVVPGAVHLINGLYTESFSILTVNDYTSIILFSLLIMLPSLILFSAAYLICEGHPLGLKLSLGVFGVALLIAIISSPSSYFALPIALLSGFAATIEILNKKRLGNTAKDSAIVTENVVKLGLRLSIISSIGIVVAMLIYTIILASPFLSVQFFTSMNLSIQNVQRICQGLHPIGSTGGVLAYALGSLLLVAFCEIVAVPIGIAAAIYLAEYSAQGRVVNTIRFFVEVLAGSPSIVIAVIGFTLFSAFLNWGSSLWGAAIALSFMALPWNIRVAEGAIKAVPRSYREASFALGASQWQTARLVMLYAAMPGIVTGILLGIGVALGETLVLLFNYTGLSTVGFPSPWWHIFNLHQQLPSLTVFILNAPGPLANTFAGNQNLPGGNPSNKIFFTYSLAFAAAVVLLSIYLVLCVGALLLRNYLNRRMKGS